MARYKECLKITGNVLESISGLGYPGICCQPPFSKKDGCANIYKVKVKILGGYSLIGLS